MFEDYLTYLLAEKRYSPLTVRAYGDDIRQFALFCLRAGDPETGSAEDSGGEGSYVLGQSMTDSALNKAALVEKGSIRLG